MKKVQINKLTLKRNSIANLKAHSIKGGLRSINNEIECWGTARCESALFTVFPITPCY